jgi:hypothetical protein
MPFSFAAARLTAPPLALLLLLLLAAYHPLPPRLSRMRWRQR